MNADAPNAIDGINVLVTRPAHQSQALCDKITGLGGMVQHLPVIEIADPHDITPALELIKRLTTFDIAIFISSNAAERANVLVTAHGGWPQHIKTAAVGKRTAATLQHIGLRVDILPQHQFDSEGLLALQEMQGVNNKHIVIFRGEGGRELLAQTLTQRGAHVEYAEVYRRKKPEIDTEEVQLAGKTGKINIITVTSNEGLQNLYDMLGNEGQHWLLDIPLIVIGQRTAELAHKLGFKTAIRAKQASDEGLVDALKEWYAIHAP